MTNLEYYDKLRTVPDNAQKKITGGRLNGKTDINPMWRIKALTEQFGPCGIGWKYEIIDKTLAQGADGEIAAFVDILMYVFRHEGGWSEPIPGTGGSMFIAKEKGGLYTSDECYKMALTDAISVACKALGVGADIYWQADATKYDKREEPPKRDWVAAAKSAKLMSEQSPSTLTTAQIAALTRAVATPDGLKKDPDKAARLHQIISDMGYTSVRDVGQADYAEVVRRFGEQEGKA